MNFAENLILNRKYFSEFSLQWVEKKKIIQIYVKFNSFQTNAK